MVQIKNGQNQPQVVSQILSEKRRKKVIRLFLLNEIDILKNMAFYKTIRYQHSNKKN